MSVPKGQIHTMHSIIKNKNSIKLPNIQLKTPVKTKVNFTMSTTSTMNKMFMDHKKGVSHLAYTEAKKGKVGSANYRGRWMGFMYRDPNKPRGGCGVCYQH